MGYIAAMGLPFPAVALAGAIALEVGGGLLLAFGLQTRLVALALAAFSAVTGVVFHGAIGDQNQFVHLLKNLAMAGGLLQIAAFGAGAGTLMTIGTGVPAAFGMQYQIRYIKSQNCHW